MRILVTGAAGFIGSHAASALIARGHQVVGVDSLNDYYDPALKHARLKELESAGNFRFAKADIGDYAALTGAVAGDAFDVFLHLAAQAGVRYALKDPFSYTRSNLVGHHNMLELARHHVSLSHLVYASSSSVYGNDTKAPFREDARADKPVSYYGATKRAGELLSHSYAELFGLKLTGLRFFTVYGPRGRPDMAYWLFTDSILNGRTVPVYGQGKLKRDFTYIDDIVAALVTIVETPHRGEAGEAPHRVYNLGNSHPEDIDHLIRTIERATNRAAKVEWAEAPPGDVRETFADIGRAAKDYGFAPKVSLDEGIERFVQWFRRYHKV